MWSPIQALSLLSLPKPAILPSQSDSPIRIVAGSEDPIGDGRRGPEALARAYGRLGGRSDVTLRIYEGARHEVLNETMRDDAVRDIIGWIAERFPLPAA